MRIHKLIEIYKIREALDALAIAEAVPRLTDAALARIEGILIRLEVATTAHDHEEMLRLNRAFHGAIYAGAEMPRLVEMISNLTDRYSIYNKVYIPKHSHHSTSEHRSIFEACRDRDVERAVDLTHQHLRRAREQMAKAIGPA